MTIVIGQDLIAFFNARIAEDEAVARKASHQKVAGPFHGNWRADSAALMANGALDRADREHIARHDPARVLAECDAKRRIVEIHHPHDHHGEHGDYVFCSACQWDHGDDSPRIDMGIEEFGKPCPTLRVLASSYADHSEYDERWRP